MPWTNQQAGKPANVSTAKRSGGATATRAVKSAPFNFGAGGGAASLKASAAQSKGSSLLDFAKGPIGTAFDIAQRPAYAIGDLIAGKPKDALKAVAPLAGPIGLAANKALTGQWNPKFQRTLPGQALATRGLMPGGKLGAVTKFAADVALDPTTYVTFGAGGVVKGAAAAAAREAARASSEKFTARLLADAAKGVKTPLSAAAQHGLEQATAKAATPRALSVGVRVPGTRAKTVTIASSERAYKAAQRVGGKVSGSRVGVAVREGMLPSGAENKAVWETYSATRRAGEAQKQAVSREAVQLGKDVKGAAKEAGIPTTQAHDLITRYLDQPALYANSIPDALKPIVERAQQTLTGFHQSEQAAGIKKGIVESYVPHLPATAKDRHLLVSRFQRGAGTPFWQKERSLPDLSAWDQAGIKPETNIARLLEVRGHSSVDEQVRQAFDQTIAKGFGKPTSHVEANAAWHAFPSTHLSGTSVPGDVAAAVNRVYDRITPHVSAEGIRKTTQFIQRVTGAWKGLALTSPGFHLRNLQSDLMAAQWAGARNPQSFWQAGKALTGRGTVKIKGRVFTAPELVALAEGHGVVRSGFAGKEVRLGIEDMSTKTGKVAVPGSGRIARASQSVGQAREDTVRLGLFIERMKAGDTAAQAAETTRHFLFDYGDTGRFVSSARKFWFPFVTYPSKAIPMVAKTWAGRPGIPATLAKLQTETNQAAGVDTGSLPVGSRASFALPIPGAAKKLLGAPSDQPLLFNPESVLPYGTLNTADPQQVSHYLGGSLLSPFVKTPIEYATKHSFFTGHQFPARAKAPAVITALQHAGIHIPGYGPKNDLFTGKQVPGYSPRLDDVLRMLPQFGQSAGLIPGGGTDSSRLSYARFFGGLSLSPYDRAKNAYYAARFGGK